MQIDTEALKQLVDEAVVPFVVQHHGTEGGSAFRRIAAALRKIYEQFDPFETGGSIVLLHGVASLESPESTELADITDVTKLKQAGFVLELTPSGKFRRWTEQPDLAEVSRHAVVYEFAEGVERIYAGGDSKEIPALFPGGGSIFAAPTFSELYEALIYYRNRLVRTSRCRILKDCWSDAGRLFFKAKPEKTMRRSLDQFLFSALRGNVEVKPEQNVDETHPIDIKVTFHQLGRVALIEIKWLGKSRKDDGSSASEHWDQRARDGAKQLADYLDANHEYTGGQTARGYLVVVDGRRRGLDGDLGGLQAPDLMHYVDQEIAYDPKYHELRTDFEVPLRMFAEPKQ